ncbi:epidermal growth factor receptor kinase substrate 8-like protein 3 [Porphyrio hochstetteri]
MGDPLGRWSTTPSRGEYEDSSQLRRSNSFSRPSGKSIYNQRKDYSQALLKPQSHFQHHVEHLLTVRLEKGVRSTEACLERLKELEAQGRVWGQDLILQVKGQELVLSDVESKEELEAYPLGSIQGCSAALGACSYDSVLAISVQEQSPPGTSVLLFQCERLGAETLRSSLEKLVKQWKEEHRSQYGHRTTPDVPPNPPPLYAPGPYAAPERLAEPPNPNAYMPPPHEPPSDYGLPDTQQMPWTNPPGQVMSDKDRDVEILNHVLGDLELFVTWLKEALGLTSTTKQKKKKKKKNKGALLPEDGFIDFFQKVKYTFNLLGRTHQHVQEPDPAVLLRLIFSALSFVLQHCPSPGLAPRVEVPLLLPQALDLLEGTLSQHDYSTWKSLGPAWNSTRAEHPKGDLLPHYVPVFSDGWLPPPVEQPPATGQRDDDSQEPPLPVQGLARSLYEFQGRNPQELTVGMGDTLQVLDQRKKWWLVQDSQGRRGYIPSNILEPLGWGHGLGGHSISQVGISPLPIPSLHPRQLEEGTKGHPAVPSPHPPALQDSPPNLLPDSPPEDVTAWLKDKGFSRITVRCLGVLSGQQLLQMSPAELRAVCPEEWRRVLFKLSAVRTSLGMGSRD